MTRNPLNVPNVLTLLRLVLIPVTAYFLATRAYDFALVTFLVAALTDFADGFIARQWKITSKLGATLDPIADKLNMLVATLLLAWQSLVPLWLAIAIVLRDILIVAGALVYRAAVGRVKIAPTRLSKLNTLFEFSVLLLVMATAASWIASGDWLTAGFVIVFATIVGSTIQYAWLWSHKALT